MGLSKHQRKLKQLRRQEREEHKQQYKSVEFMLGTCTVVAMNAAKKVWKSDATNPKMELFLEYIFKTWQDIADNKVSFETVCSSVETETKIKYNPETDTFTNLKGTKTK